MKKYVKRPVVIEAVQWKGRNFEEVKIFTNNSARLLTSTMNGLHSCIIPTLEGQHIATEGDYIIKGVEGEFYSCKPHIFEKTYESWSE